MIEVACAETVAGRVDAEALRKVLAVFLQQLFTGERSVSLYLTDDAEMRELNREFREKDRTTDVLSWSYWEDDPDAECVGDLAVSLEQVARQAQENGWPVETELVRMLAHGCAHLAGWDHERSEDEAQQMLAVEVALLAEVGYPGLYS
ncbi:MAG: rRNA maturation RNase YbeY [SAR324 cluster bacterium]|nr:rRNA maturation RNase YbeY [SAR324 cluster bacterium]